MSAAEQIRETLQPLLCQAREKGKWLYTSYQSIWLSPDELDAHHDQNIFLWGAANWELRDPQEHIRQLEQEVENAKTGLAKFKWRVKVSQELTP